MSSQLTSPPDQRDPAPPEKPQRIQLSLSQILGSALAAMTAAALGSRLGVAGTIIGAAMASIIAAVGGSLYTASIRASRERVRTVLVRRPPTSARTDAAAPPSTETAQLVAADTEFPVASTPTARKRLISWKTIGAGALAAFAVAAVAITGFEAITGNALSGGTGTTITQVRHDTARRGASTTDESATPHSGASAEPSAPASASADPAATPDPSASADPSATESAGAQPAPSASASAQPAPAPSATSPTGPGASANPTDGTPTNAG